MQKRDSRVSGVDGFGGQNADSLSLRPAPGRTLGADIEYIRGYASVEDRHICQLVKAASLQLCIVFSQVKGKHFFP